MTKKQPGPAKADGQSDAVKALRARAEEAIRAGRTSDRPPQGEEERLFHELQVHQIELEMQFDELRQTQDELEASRAKYFGFYNLAPVGYFTISGEGLVLETNLTAARLFGIERIHLPGQPFTRLIAAEDQDTYYLSRKKLLETGKAQSCELRMERPDGTLFWARLEGSAAGDAAAGAPACYVVMTDITGRKAAEEKLKASERALSKAQEISHLGNWELDIQTGKVTWSDELYRFFGFKPGEVEPTPDLFMGLVHPEERKTTQDNLHAVISSRLQYAEGEIRIIRPDGKERVLFCKLEGVAGTDGKPEKLIGANLDITERKEAEEALRESEVRFRQLSEVAFEGIVIVIDGKTVDCNSAFARMFGYTPEEIIGKSPYELASPESFATAMDHIRRESEETYEIVGRKKDGTLFPVEVQGRSMQYNGMKVRVTAMRDITQRAAMDKALRESEEKWRGLFSILPVGVSILDEQGRIVGGNPALEETLGITEDGLKEGAYQKRQYIFPNGSPVPPEKFPSALAMHGQRVVRHVEIGIVKEDGSTIWTDVNAAPLPFSDAACVVVTSDITARKAAEEKLIAAKAEAEAATRLKNKFISLLSHDLRSPLAGVIQLQKATMATHMDPHCDECRVSLGMTLGVCDTMIGMADELLESALLQGESLRLHRKLCRTRDICHAVIGGLNHLAANKGVALKNGVPPDIRSYVDKALFQSVIQNLVMNAIKFSNHGGVVTITAGGQNILAVKDTGTGIVQGFLPDLFKYEVKTTAAGTAGERGTGLGLPMSMDIMKAHGGTIRVASQKGRGCTFFAELPDMKPLVLLANDDEATLFVLGKYLEGMGAEVVTASNGQEAWDVAQSREPALIITDIKMPVMDGLTLLDKVKRSARHFHIPVIIITANSDMQIREKAFEHKADDFIIKPFSEADFMPRIGRFISG